MVGMDLETSGLNPEYHEIIQIGLLPLDANLEPRKDLPPFDFKFRPKHLDRVDLNALNVSRNTLADIVETGIDPDAGKDLFYMWFERLKIGETRKLVPLGHNITGCDIPFLRFWLGEEAYRQYFFGHPRDTMIIAAYLNDRAEYHAEQTPFPKLTLTELAKKLGIEILDGVIHDAVYDAYIASQCYKKLLLELFNI